MILQILPRPETPLREAAAVCPVCSANQEAAPQAKPRPLHLHLLRH